MTIIDTEKSFVPNWFDKEHIEEFLERSITDDEWDNFLDQHGADLAAWLSNEVRWWVEDAMFTEVDDDKE